jgi:hypothetical protein
MHGSHSMCLSCEIVVRELLPPGKTHQGTNFFSSDMTI